MLDPLDFGHPFTSPLLTLSFLSFNLDFLQNVNGVSMFFSSPLDWLNWNFGWTLTSWSTFMLSFPNIPTFFLGEEDSFFLSSLDLLGHCVLLVSLLSASTGTSFSQLTFSSTYSLSFFCFLADFVSELLLLALFVGVSYSSSSVSS